MIVSCKEMKAIEKHAFAKGIEAETLMEQAGEKIADVVRQFSTIPGKCIVHFGKGHNGGDALVAARHLAKYHWKVELRAAFPEKDWAPLTLKKFNELNDLLKKSPRDVYVFPRSVHPVIVLDGLLGIGAGGALREPIKSAARKINQLRATSNATVFAMDLPTGLDGDTGRPDADCVTADFTLTIGFAKKGLVADAAANHVGRLAVLSLADLKAPSAKSVEESAATPPALAPLLPRRKFDSNKGNYGRVGIVAGGLGTTGAAVMCAEAALRAGAGLITLFATPDIYHTLAAACPPEIMVRPVESYLDVLNVRLDTIAIGPGLGNRDTGDILEVICKSPLPMVVDAEALNLISADSKLLTKCAGKRLLTPHPGEMARLFPGSKKLTRRETAKKFTAKYPVTLLLKGSRTIIAEKGKPHSYNTTGTPGMATGGMGDILTGVCAALIGQGLPTYDAARTGAWLCGRAAEIAIFNRLESEESLTATDLFKTLGAAFKQLRAECY